MSFGLVAEVLLMEPKETMLPPFWVLVLNKVSTENCRVVHSGVLCTTTPFVAPLPLNVTAFPE